ncbi:MAG: histidinol-phosphate transaminase [Burkholderiaceae bacterium]
MSKFWSPRVHNLTPYMPGEQPKIPGLVKLNTNENPYGPSPRVLAAINAEAERGLQLYPDPNASFLKQAIATYYDVAVSKVFVGNGSDEVLAHAFQAFFVQADPILFPNITYSFYKVYCQLYGISYTTVPLDPQMAIQASDYDQPCGGIAIANPNAPTGIALSLADIEKIVKRHPDQVVLVDEAYVDFGASSAVALVKKYSNILIVQTFSKSRALAGLRIGFAIGDSALIEALERVKNSFNSYPLSRLAIVGGVAAIEDEGYFQEKRQLVISTRDRLTARLEQLGFLVCPSSTNFLFVSHPEHDAASLVLGLRARSILVRHFPQSEIKNFMRISIGNDPECDTLYATIASILDTPI